MKQSNSNYIGVIQSNCTCLGVKQSNSNCVGVRPSKFRHLQGVVRHRSLHIDNLRNLSQSVPGESDGLHVNKRFCAFPLGGPGGLIGVIKVSTLI